MTRKYLSRRTFLHGTVAGATVSLALPPLEAMLGTNGAFADGTTDEPFFGLFYWANGLPWNDKHGAALAGNPDLWTPTTTGADYSAPQLLAPLAAHRVNVATGLQPTTAIPTTPAGQGDGHMRGFMVALTGDRPRPEGFNHGSHTLTALRPSIDQVIARHEDFYANQPRFRSLVVGASEARFHGYGHWNAISYNGPNSLNLPINQPSALFDHMFRVPAEAAELGRRSLVLDSVREEANSLRLRLGPTDRQRLDQHLEHIFEIQNRLDGTAVTCTEPARPNDGGDLIQKTSEMARLLAVAVDCGLTRVFSFMLTSPATTHIFSNLGVPDGMHKTCHDGHWDRVRDITLHQMQAFSAFLDRFAEVSLPSGGTLLDRACILGTSEYGEGWKHNVSELPVVIAGGACGALNRGIHTRDAGSTVSKAQLTALKAVGLNVDSFGFNGGETSDTVSGFLA